MNLLHTTIFYITAFLLIISSFLAIISKRIMHCILYALISFILTGFLFFALNATFIGAVQISIYGIALSILFAIAINLTDYSKETEQKLKLSPRFFLSIIGTFLICSTIIFMIIETANYDFNFAQYLYSNHILTSLDTSHQLSLELLNKNTYPFELLGIYLLTALIGIAILFVFKGSKND